MPKCSSAARGDVKAEGGRFREALVADPWPPGTGPLPGQIANCLRDLVRPLEFRVGFAGRFSAGKSTLINALAGVEVARVAGVAETECPWIFTSKRNPAYWPSVTGLGAGGGTLRWPESGSTRACRLRYIDLQDMDPGIVLVDLPGVGSPNEAHTLEIEGTVFSSEFHASIDHWVYVFGDRGVDDEDEQVFQHWRDQGVPLIGRVTPVLNLGSKLPRGSPEFREIALGIAKLVVPIAGNAALRSVGNLHEGGAYANRREVTGLKAALLAARPRPNAWSPAKCNSLATSVTSHFVEARREIQARRESLHSGLPWYLRLFETIFEPLKGPQERGLRDAELKLDLQEQQLRTWMAMAGVQATVQEAPPDHE